MAQKSQVDCRIARYAPLVAHDLAGHIEAGCDEVPRGYEAVPAVIASSAQDVDAAGAVGAAKCRRLSGEGRAGVLHQDDARYAKHADGVLVKFAHLAGGDDLHMALSYPTRSLRDNATRRGHAVSNPPRVAQVSGRR
jgi:hypothetical protein